MKSKNKRMITHMELDRALDKQGKVKADVFDIYFPTYYKLNTDPIKTGKTEVRIYLQDTLTVVDEVLEDGRDVYDGDKVLIYEISFGDWLTGSMPNVFGKVNRSNRHDRLKVNDLWWGDTLKKSDKKEIKGRLYGYLQMFGNIALRQEVERLADLKKNPPATYADALTHLRNKGKVNVTLEGEGTFDIWYEDTEGITGYFSEYKGNILYDNARAVLGVTINGVTDRDEDKIKKIKYKLI